MLLLRNPLSLAVLCLVGAAACAPDERTEDPPIDTRDNVLQRGLYDCSESHDTGYSQGNDFSIDVVTVDAKPVEVDTANAYILMQQAAQQDGVELRIVSGFRTNAQQEYLYGCYINCNCNNCNLAAPPGYSNHQSGHALDLNTSEGGVLNWLNNHGASFGFERTVPSENWHWEWWGGGPGGGPCGIVLPCDPLPAQGGVIDEEGGCFELHGPSNYWRAESGAGQGGGLLWTNAFDTLEPSNWAQWRVPVSAPGVYELAVYLDDAHAQFSATKYEVDTGETRVALVVDQGAGSGWTSLGEFQLTQSASVKVFDDHDGPVGEQKRIAVDAVRALPAVSAPPPAEGEGEGEGEGEAGGEGEGEGEASGEGEGESAGEGEGEGLQAQGGGRRYAPAVEDGSCASVGVPVIEVLLVLLGAKTRRRRRGSTVATKRR